MKKKTVFSNCIIAVKKDSEEIEHGRLKTNLDAKGTQRLWIHKNPTPFVIGIFVNVYELKSLFKYILNIYIYLKKNSVSLIIKLIALIFPVYLL